MRVTSLIAALAASSCVVALTAPANAQGVSFNIPAGDLKDALDAYGRQSGKPIIYMADEVRSVRSNGYRGTASLDVALAGILSGTGFAAHASASGAIAIVRMGNGGSLNDANQPQKAGAENAAFSDESAKSEPQVETNTKLTDIVVVATRRNTSIQKVPGAITAFNREGLRQIAPTNIGAVLAQVPGVSYVGESTYRPTLNIRGVQGTNEDAAVAMYIDGVYVGHDLAQNITNLEVETIQVLRGPQGALYGKNTLGGAVLVNSRAPTFEFEANGLAAYGDHNSYILRSSVSGPLADDKLAFAVSGYATGNDGRFHNLFTGKDVGSGKDRGGRAALLLKLSDSASIVFRGDYNKNSYEEANRKGLYYVTPLGSNISTTGFSTDVVLDIVGHSATEIYGGSINGTFKTDAFTLTSVTAIRGFRVTSIRDADSTGLNGGTQSIAQQQRQYSQEFTLTSPGGARFNWIAGVQLFSENLTELFRVFDRTGLSGMRFPAARTPVIYDIDTQKYRTKSIGLYAQADFRIFDALTLAAGVRYSFDDRKYFKIETVTLSNPTEIAVQYTYPESGSWDAIIPEASLTYSFSDNARVYGKIARSYRPGGYNVNSTYGANNAFGEESATAYELGLRVKAFDSRLIFNTTAFRMDWHNQQVSYIGALGFVVGNANSRSQGVEVDAQAVLFPGLQLSLSGAYLDAKFGSALLNYRNPVTRVASIEDAKGSPLSFSSKWSGNAVLSYRHDFAPDRTMFLRGDISYKSSQYLQPLRPDLAAPSIVRLNARAEYTFGRYTAALFVRNALNKLTSYVSASSATNDTIGITQPRSYGLELSFKL